jgi:hypothetical protein
MLKVIAILTLLLLYMLPSIALATFKLPDTGQTTCYDTSGNVINCAGAGQDGSYSINPMSYTDNSDGTVTDYNTGLTWQKQDDGKSYNWYQASGTYYVSNYPSSQNVCESLNLGGHTDWRLPTEKELGNIVDYSVPYPGPTIKSTVFPNTQSSFYWSSTVYVEGPSAWIVDFARGGSGSVSESNSYYVRCVRGGQSSQMLVDNGDSTVTDNNTGLMWQQGEPGNMSWGNALSYCQGLSLINHADWRLPNIRELESLVDDTRRVPAINTSFFPNAYASSYWSSTTSSSDPSGAWYVGFSGGAAAVSVKDNDGIYVRCVRGESGAMGHFTVSAPSSATAGTAFNFTVTALDQYNKTVIGYSGRVHFTSSDGAAVLPADAKLSKGVGTFSATLKTAGSQTITATDTVTDASGAFTATGSMTKVRNLHTATLLPNGQVLVAGGLSNGFDSSAELYDPATGSFTATGSMNTARLQATATLLPNGKVLIAGGLGSQGYLNSAELYDPANGTFTATGSMTTARQDNTATLLPNGKVLIAGGENGPSALYSAELYDPATGTFNATGNMTLAHVTATATLLSNGKVLIAGGGNSSGDFSSAELYDPSSGTFTATGSMITARSLHTATLLPIGKVLIAGGRNRRGYLIKSAELYDPATGSFTATGSMTTVRNYHTATLLTNGQVLIAGGYNNRRCLNSAELYNPASGTFTATGSMTTARQYYTATLLPNGQVLIAGGVNRQSGLSSAELYLYISTITGTSSSINVSPASATPFMVSAPSSATSGTAFNFTVTALDQFNNTATGYSGTVHFTSSDGAAVLPADATLSNGVGTFSATLKTAGSQTITVTDTVTASITGSSNGIYCQGISINIGAPFTITTAVTLNLLYTGAVSMQFITNGTTWTAWEKYETLRSFTLSPGDGVKKVQVRFKDSSAAISSVYSATIILDTKAPLGTITINGGTYATNDPNVILSISVADVNGVAQMQFSDNNKWSGVPWEQFATTRAYTIPATLGMRTVYARFRDAAGKVSAVCSDSILYTTTLPIATTGAVTINGGAEFATTTSAQLTITTPTHDPAYTLMCFSTNGTKWTSWETVKLAKSLTLPAGDGIKTVYARFQTAAGTESGIYMNTIILDTKPPVGTISINDGAATTTNPLVTLSLSAADANGVTDMQFSTNNKWTGLGWEDFAPTKTFNLGTSTPGNKSVYVRFRDAAGNISTAYSDSIKLVAP